MDHPNKTINLSKTNKNQKNTNRSKTGLDYTFTSDRVPKAFVELACYFIPEAMQIEEFWRMTAIAAYKHNCEQNLNVVLDTAIHAFKQLIRKMKTCTIARPIAYFYGILTRKFEEQVFTVHETERKNGSQSSNLYVFNRFPKPRLAALAVILLKVER